VCIKKSEKLSDILNRGTGKQTDLAFIFKEEIIMAGIGATGSIGAYAAQSDYSKSTKTKKSEAFGTPDKTAGTTGTGKTSETAQTRGKTEDYGRIIGQPELSEKAAKYYEQLKKRYGNYDFILVSRDQKENAKANAAKYANGYKTVVLIDEDKIEQMATDEKFRKQYEGILSGAAAQIQQLKTSLQSSGAQVKGFGMQVNDGGTLSFFAVLKKSSAEQKARIEKKAEQKRAEKKAAEKKAAKKEKEEQLKEKRAESDDTEETVTITANSIEELLSRIDTYNFNTRSDEVRTQSERQVGQNIDFRG
jgi:hypothetical protein